MSADAPVFRFTPVADAAGWAAFRELLLEYGGKDLADPALSTIWSDIDSLPGRYAPPSGAVVLAHRGDALVGCGALVATREPGLAEVKRIYVRESSRRQGLAREITQRLLLLAPTLGYRRAAISSWDYNERALTLYRQLGFTPVAAFKDSAAQNLVFLGRDLPAAH